MRIGKNPSKSGVPSYVPKHLGIALLVYVPVMEGYFKHSLDILKYQITSLKHNTRQDFDLLVFDNGSCSQVIDVLREYHARRTVDWLVLSRHNLGKVGAWNWIFGSMPNELICYADSDVLFRQGWLQASLDILQSFPNVGMLSAQPTFHDVLEGKGHAHLTLVEDEKYRVGVYRPPHSIVEEYVQGIGADENLSAQFFDLDLPCITDLRDETTAVLGAAHMQFIIPREVARQMVPLQVSKGLHRAETTSLDRRIDELGYLHLSTRDNYVLHMGNMVTGKLLAEVGELGGSPRTSLSSEDLTLSRRSGLFRFVVRLLNYPRFNQFFLRVYDFLYRALYVEKV